MPLVRETPNKNPSYRTFSSKQTPRTENTPQPRLSSSAQKTVNTISKNNDDKGASKYVMAVNMAKERFADDPDVNKTIFRNTVDDIYDSMKEEGDKSAADLRGENPLQQFGRGVGQFFDTINNAIGYGLDTAFDATIGNLIDGISGGTAGAKDWFDAEDMAFIPDLAEDIGLSLIPYAGIPLAMAKNAAQRTDEISEALTGRDSVTQEKLNGWEQGGRVADALLGVGLAAGVRRRRRDGELPLLGVDLVDRDGRSDEAVVGVVGGEEVHAVRPPRALPALAGRAGVGRLHARVGGRLARPRPGHRVVAGAVVFFLIYDDLPLVVEHK